MNIRSDNQQSDDMRLKYITTCTLSTFLSRKNFNFVLIHVVYNTRIQNLIMLYPVYGVSK